MTPTWAQSPEAKRLLQAILTDRPDWFLRRYDSGYGGEIIYKGRQGSPVAQLKRMHSDWFDAELAKLDARWAAGETPTREESPCNVEDANALIHRLLDLHDRFWARVEKGDDCWLWVGGRNARRGFAKSGYGAFHVGDNFYVRASRMAVFLTTLEWPEGMVVCHKCDNPACVRPDHLFVGTHGDNARDRAAKGRGYVPSCPVEKHARGVKHGCVKLTPEQVLEIRKAEGNQKEIGARYGVSQSTVSHIKLRLNWAHLQDEADEGLTECVGDPMLRKVA